MRRVSGKVSLATRRIWGDPEDEDELSAITHSGLRLNGSELISSVKDGGHSESAYNDDFKLRAKITYPSQALENDVELPVASKKQNSLLNEKYALPSTDLDTPDEILHNPLTKTTLLEQTESNFKEADDSSSHNSISSSAVRPPLSYHDASEKDFAPCNGTKLTRDHSVAPQILEDLDEQIEISHQCSKKKIEDIKASEGTTEVEKRFSAPKDPYPQENLINTNGPCLGEHMNDSGFENAVGNNSLIPLAIGSEDIISRNCDPSNCEGKLHLKNGVSEFDNDNIPEIVPSTINKLGSCDEEISTNLESEIPQVSVLIENENQSICKSSPESNLQLYSEEIDDDYDTLKVVEPITVNDKYLNPAYMSSSLTDLSNSVAVENNQNIEEAPEKETNTSLDLSDEINDLDKVLSLSSHLESKNNTHDSVSLDEEKSSRCTEITEYTSEEFTKPIISDSALNVAKDESTESNLIDLNAHEGQTRSQIIGLSNEEADEDYTLITVFNNLYNKVRVSDTKFTDNHDFLGEPSNKDNDCTNTPLTNVQDSEGNDNNLSSSDGDEKYSCIQSSSLNLPEIVDQQTASVETITYEDNSSEYDIKPNDISIKSIEDTENSLEAKYTTNEETSPNHNPDNRNNAEFSGLHVLDTDSSKNNVMGLKLDIDKNEVDLKDLDEAENEVEVKTEDRTEEIVDRFEDIIADTTTNTSMNRTEDRIEDKNEGIIDRIEDIIADKIEEIVDRFEDIIADTNTNTNTNRTEDGTEEKIKEIIDRIEDIIVDTTEEISEERIEDRTENKTEEKLEEITDIIEDRTEGNAKDVVENWVIDIVNIQGENQARDNIEANNLISEASKPENKGDINDYITNEVDGLKNAHGTNLKISQDVKIESMIPIDQKFGKDNKKLHLEGAELSETETVKTTRNRRTWLRYVKSFEKRHEEGDSTSMKLSSGRESSGRSERGDHNEIIAPPPKNPETPMKKKYTPSHSGSTTPDKRRRSFRKKIKEKISDTLHKLKD